MKKNNAESRFQEPTRQSLVAILLIIFKTYKVLVRQVWPFLLLYLFKGKTGGFGDKFLIGISIAAVIGMFYSIINYFRYYFYINQDELVIESGVFKRSKLNVPFDRIQTINFEQNIIHRVFNVVRLKIDTAGSAKAEFQFHAIDNEAANDLRDLLLSKKRSTIKSAIEEEATQENKEEYKTIMKLELIDLIKAGAVENHLKSGGLILAGMWWIYSTLQDTAKDFDIEKDVDETILAQLGSGFVIVVTLIIFFFILSFLVSMVKMIITNYDLKFMRSENGFKINGGLFTKKHISALDHKIQVISWGDNPLKKLIGIKDLRLKQASSIVLNKKTSIKIPSCTEAHIDLVKNTLYGAEAFQGIDYSPIDKRYFYRIALILGSIAIIIVSLLTFFEAYKQAIILSIAAIVVIFSFYLSYRKKRYGFNKEMIVIRGGTYGDKTEMLPIHKIQSLSRSQSPYQRRKDLASLTLFTASGRVGVPYIDNNIAQRIMDEFLYRIEVDKRKWM